MSVLYHYRTKKMMSQRQAFRTACHPISWRKNSWLKNGVKILCHCRPIYLYVCQICTKVCLWTARRSSRTDGQTAEYLQRWLRSNAVPPSAPQGWRSGAPDSLPTGLADPPEDWPAESPYHATAVITREPNFGSYY